LLGTRSFDNDEGVTMPSDIQEQLIKYLSDAHSIEEQALAQLRSAPDVAGDPELSRAFRDHLAETERHERLTRELLEARGAAPSRLKDAVMSAGGKGFLLFAKLQPDTPGKLAAHALSYEALELASYELLSRVAERASAVDVADAAQQIRDEERMMMERLESSFDVSVDASLRELGTDDLQEQLRKYLADAHAIEEQAIQLLERAPKLSEGTPIAEVYSEHLDETRDHAELIADRLTALGGDPSTLKDAALRLGALNWGTFFQSHPDTPGKLAAFAFAFEHLEIGGYEQLRRVAERAGDTATAGVVERILEQERTAADRIAAHFDEAAAAALASQGVA
jgi:ferritin-like metal-binding protein YciE